MLFHNFLLGRHRSVYVIFSIFVCITISMHYLPHSMTKYNAVFVVQSCIFAAGFLFVQMCNRWHASQTKVSPGSSFPSCCCLPRIFVLMVTGRTRIIKSKTSYIGHEQLSLINMNRTARLIRNKERRVTKTI